MVTIYIDYRVTRLFLYTVHYVLPLMPFASVAALQLRSSPFALSFSLTLIRLRGAGNFARRERSVACCPHCIVVTPVGSPHACSEAAVAARSPS